MAKLHEVTISLSPDGYVFKYQLNCTCNWHGQDNSLGQARASAQRHQQSRGIDPVDSEINMPPKGDQSPAARSRYEAQAQAVAGQVPAANPIDINTMYPTAPAVGNVPVLQKDK